MSPELNALSFRDLSYIVAVARVSHFRRAAEECFVSQPTLSAQVKKVERSLGVKIFERSSRRVRLTDAGRRIVEQAALVLEEAEKLPALVRQREPLAGPLSIGVLGTIGPYLLPLVLPALESEFPDLSLYIVEGMTEGLADELRKGRLDLLIASPSPLLEDFQEVGSFFERFVLCVNSGDRVAGRKRLAVHELDEQEMLFLGPGHCLTDQACGFCASVSAAPSPFQAASLETLRLLVAAGRGAALIPELAVSSPSGASSSGMLSYIPFREPEVGREITLYHRRNSPFGKEAEILERLVGGCVP
ncbi:MAG: LysR substrate-binding domain-containing protein [Verrucomicrobiales bacterium]